MKPLNSNKSSSVSVDIIILVCSIQPSISPTMSSLTLKEPIITLPNNLESLLSSLFAAARYVASRPYEYACPRKSGKSCNCSLGILINKSIISVIKSIECSKSFATFSIEFLSISSHCKPSTLLYC